MKLPRCIALAFEVLLILFEKIYQLRINAQFLVFGLICYSFY